jgi:3-oxoacyl-[acyl-carrier-protein] synthase-3
MYIGIRALSAHVPENIVSNDELAKTVDTSDEWIRSHTGIGERRISDSNTFASDLAVTAGKKLLDNEGLTADEIDMIIVATSSPDFNPFPSTASIVQDRLGCINAGAFDLQAGCSGFSYALETARGLVSGGSLKRVLVIGAEVLTKITNWKDRNTCVLFGDGAGAALVEETNADGHIIEYSWLRSQGSDSDALKREAGGTRIPYNPETSQADDFTIKMNGKKVYLFAVNAIVQTIKELCNHGGITPEDIDWFVPHQANSRIIEAAAHRLGLGVERFFMNLERFANTSAASIPLALDEMITKGLLKPGQRVITVGFGAGLTYGGNLIRW